MMVYLLRKFGGTVAIYLVAVILSGKFLNTDGEECQTMDIRNRPASLLKLTNCTVIRGSLIFVLMTGYDLNPQDFAPYSFPKLREVTEFMLVYQVFNLTTLRNLFPNLVVIRGQQLFLNYALAIDDVPDLTEVGLQSLVTIQRGLIFINRCPKLCHISTIDWSSISRSNENSIKQVENKSCPTKLACKGCRDDRCWSSDSCQKFEDDNLLDLMKPFKCHPLCLGGCRNSTAAGCNVCKGLSDHGVCVEKCPSNKLTIPEYFRCYTHEECKDFGRMIHRNECLRSCPAGFSSTNFETMETSLYECFKCHGPCPKVCDPWSIQHLSDAERLKGCTVIQGTLQIRITNRINETELEQNLSTIEEIYGFLKITGTSSITSLSFLKGLKKIHGNDLDYNKYALVIYYNQNLFDLWPKSVEKDMVLARGGIFIHSNYRLCFLKVQELQNSVVHNRTLDQILRTDEEPSCNPIKIKTSYKVLGVNSVTIYWKLLDDIEMDGVEYILFFTDVVDNDKVDRKGNRICPEDIWTTQLILPDDLKEKDKDEPFAYNLTKLKPYTQYGFYLKTYRVKDKEDGLSSVESAIEYFTTEATVPSQQSVATYSKTPDSLTLAWSPRLGEHDRIDYYVIDLFKQPDKKEILDYRDYCVHPLEIIETDDTKDANNDRCCDDEISFQEKIGARFLCLDDDDCRNHRYSDRFVRNTNKKISHTFDTEHWPVPNSDTFVKTLAFKNTHEKFTIKDLEPYSRYIIHFYACNNVTRCGQYALHSDRTAQDPDGDRVYPELGLSIETQHVEVIFEEPKKPNGVTVAYIINIKEATCNKDSCSDTICVTRRNHELANYRYVFNLDRGQYKVRVQSVSLAGYGPYSEWLEFDPVKFKSRKISWIWYVLTVIAATGILYLFFRWRKKAERIPASALIRYRYTDRDELILNAEES